MSDPFDDIVANRKADALRQSMAQGVTFGGNPDQYVQNKQTATALGVSPALVATNPASYQQAATIGSFDYNDYAKNYPALTNWASTPEHALLAQDDMQQLAKIEASASAPSLASLSTSQRQAVIEERKRVYLANAQKNEVTSAMANTNTGFYSPFLNFGANLVSALDATSATANAATGLIAGTTDPSQTWDAIKAAWRNPGQGGIGDVAQNTVGSVNKYISVPIKTGVQQYLVDPQTKQQFENPDFQTFGKSMAGRMANAVLNRGTVISIEGGPGMLAGFGVGGEVGGVGDF